MKKILISILLLLASAGPSMAQADPFNAIGSNETGLKPFGSYDGSKFDQIDLATGGLNLTIDIASLSARGHKSTYGWRYNSKFWIATSSLSAGQIVTTWTIENTSLGESHNSQIFPVNAGWRDTRGRFTYVNSQILCEVNGTMKTYSGLHTGFTYVDENGAKHSFPNWNASLTALQRSQCFIGNNYNTGYSNEGGMIDGHGGVGFPSGVSSGSQGQQEDKWALTNTAPMYYDSNGNSWSVLSAANGQTFVQLTLDGTPRLSSIQVLNSSGAWQNWGIVNTTAPNTGSPHTGSLSVPGTLTMPNGRSFTFTYGGDWGELTRVTLPTGGYIRYEYATIANGATSGNWGYLVSGRYLTKRAVSPDGTAASEQVTTYSYSLSSTTNPNRELTTTVTRPDGTYEIHHFDISWEKPTKELWVEWHAAGGALLRRKDNTWACDTAPFSSYSSASDIGEFELPSYGPANCHITQSLTTLDDGKKSQVNTTYDSFSYTGDDGQNVTESHGNIKKVEETDFGTSGPGAVMRVTKYQYLHEQNPAYAATNVYIVDRVSAKWIGTPSNTFSLTETQYDTTSPTGLHGNPSSTKSALLQSGAPNPDSPPDSSVSAWLSTSYSYDQYGNRTSMTDPGSHTTTYEYNQCTSGNLSATNYPITGMREEKTWNCSIGATASSKDVNSQVTTYEFNDALFRLTKVTKPDTGYVTLSYDDSGLVVTATELINNGAATTLSAQHQFDGLGRILESRLLGDACGSIKSDTVYDSVGRLYQSSNPYCLNTESTYGLTSYKYDGLDRKIQMIPPDGTGSSDNTSTTFASNCATVTDEAGKIRKSCTDALGRVSQVFEPNASGSLVNETDFQYDVLNNLLCVVQKGTDTTAFSTCAAAPATWRPRSATYDSLSRLLTATNPESGTIMYQYDSNSACPSPNSFPALLTSKTDARGVRRCYQYDAMNRLTQRNYSNGETTVTNSYDQTNCLGLSSCHNTGHRTSMADAGGSEFWAYDPMGRVAREQRITNGVTKTTSYTYNLDGSVATVVYPSGRTISYGYDAVTRPVSAADTANGINYVTSATYFPSGGLSSLQNGSSLISKFYYNKRLQPCRISVKFSGTSPSQCNDVANIGNILDFSYDYNLGVADNGQVKQIANNRNSARTQNFTYDSLNRIATAATQATSGPYAWGQQFGYDIWGNLLGITVTQGSATMLSVSADTSNWISGFCYDAAGNLLAQAAPPCPLPTYVYDAENRLKSVAGVTYTYDGDGHRVQKSNGKLYWYGSGSEILDESDASGNITSEYVFFGGKRIARQLVSPSQVQYYFADHLGSSRVVSDSSGAILDDSDFYPFGGERAYSSSSGNAYKFTGKERDTESGLDDFGARYFTAQFGRFMTPDWSASPVLVPYADIGNPQTFNQYAYVSNNPINGVDPEGHFRLDPPGSFKEHEYHDPDTGDPLYGQALTKEQAKAQSDQNTAKQQRDPAHKQSFFGKLFGKIFGKVGKLVQAVAVPFMRWGRLGGPAHRAEIARQQSALEEQGYKVDREVYIKTSNGAKSGRFADLRGVKDGETVYVQVGRTNQDGSPVAREVQAMDDIEAETGIRPIFAPYDTPTPTPVAPLDGPIDGPVDLPMGPEIPIEPIP